jgi:hypothetical protein
MASKPATKAAPKAAAKTTPAAKTAAPAKKAAAPAPAPEPEAESVELAEGSTIKFLGYGEDVPEDQQFLVADETYTIAGFTEANGNEGDEDYDAGGAPYVLIENPEFNAKKKESETNPKEIAIPVYDGEYEVVAESEAEAEAETEAEAEPEEAAPAPATKAPKATKAVGKTAAKTAAPAPAAEPEAEAETDELPDLEGEDEEVLALINGDTHIIQVAQELEAAAATSEYRLGGVLYHIKKNKSYLEVEGGAERYGEKGGFELFLQDYFNIEYRKTMYLIDIYVAFTQAQIENPAEAVAAMGWTKASKIARPMIENVEGAADLIELANNNTVADLSTAIKEQVTVGGTREGGTKVTRTTLKFRLLEQDGVNTNSILEAVKSAQGHKDIGESLVFIVNDWASNNMPNTSKAAAAPKATKAVGKAAPAAKKVAAK